MSSVGSLDDFSAKFGDGQRVSHFRVQGAFVDFNGNISHPEQGPDNFWVESFLVKSAQWPTSNIGVIEVPFRGRKIKKPGDRVFNEWNITCHFAPDRTSGSVPIYDAFIRWMDVLNSHSDIRSRYKTKAGSGNDGVNVAVGGKTDWIVYALDPSGFVNSTIKLVGCFPTEVGTIDFNWDTLDALVEFPVTLQYDYWLKGKKGQEQWEVDENIHSPRTPAE